MRNVVSTFFSISDKVVNESDKPWWTCRGFTAMVQQENETSAHRTKM